MSKHEQAPTLGRYPQLYPYVMQHIGEQPIQGTLRDRVNSLERSIMMGSPDEAQFLAWLVRTMKLSKIIEVGVFRGTTTLALALALKDNGSNGRLVGFDISSDFAEVGKAAWKEAGVDHLIDFRVGPAVEGLDALLAEGVEGTFDLAFIDADKTNYAEYYERSLKLLRPGGIIAVDNVLWGGSVLEAASTHDDSTKAIVALNEFIRNDKRVSATMLPVADGVYLCTKL